jgi:hypothetical protein
LWQPPACWCWLDQSYQADVLPELANADHAPSAEMQRHASQKAKHPATSATAAAAAAYIAKVDIWHPLTRGR